MGRKKARSPEAEGELDELVEAPPPVRRPEDATPENPLEFRYVLTFKPRRFRGKNWTGSGKHILKPVKQVAAKQRKRGRR